MKSYILIFCLLALFGCGHADGDSIVIDNSDIEGCKQLGTYGLNGLTVINHTDWEELHSLFLIYGGQDKQGQTVQGFYFNNEAHLWTGSDRYLEIYGHEACHFALELNSGVIAGPVAFY